MIEKPLLSRTEVARKFRTDPASRRERWRRTSVLYLNTHQKKVRQLCDVDRARSTCAQESFPVVLDLAVKAAVLDVMRQQVLNLERSVETERDARVCAAKSRSISGVDAMSKVGRIVPQERIALVVNSVGLESERLPLSVLAEDRSRGSLHEVLPVQVFARPGVAETSCCRERGP